MTWMTVESAELMRMERERQLYRQALEEVRDKHPAPASPGPCVVCAIVYGTLIEADQTGTRHDD